MKLGVSDFSKLESRHWITNYTIKCWIFYDGEKSVALEFGQKTVY